jgi:hypothetical protein
MHNPLHQSSEVAGIAFPLSFDTIPPEFGLDDRSGKRH